MKRRLMYHGERLANFNSEVLQCFKTKAGKEYFYAGIKFVYFGDIVETENEKMKKRPEKLKQFWEPTEKERLAYESQKLIVRNYRLERRKELILKKPHPKIAQAVELFRPFYSPLSNYERRSLLAWFGNECSKKGKRK